MNGHEIDETEARRERWRAQWARLTQQRIDDDDVAALLEDVGGLLVELAGHLVPIQIETLDDEPLGSAH